MATREKTVVFAFPMQTTTVANNTVTNLSQISLFIPEASPTFTSVFVEIGFQDLVTATGGTITEHRCGLRLGAAAYTTITETDDIANSAENIAGVVGPFDFTSHFTTNWTGTSMTCDLQVYFSQSTGTTLGMTNVTALVHVTYTYDDAAATQLKTVRIPLESLASTLPTTATNFGTSQIPILTGGSGILCENSPVIRQWFIVIEGNEFNINTTDFTISARIDALTTATFGLQECALQSNRFCRWVFFPPDGVPATTAAHDLQLWASKAAANGVTATLYVTYEFTLSGTTRILNSVVLPLELASPLGAISTAEASRFQREYMLVEPGTITLRQSGFRLNYNATSTLTALLLRLGSQSYRSYTSAAGVSCGMYSVQQRFDSGSAAGGGITLNRGANTLTIDGYATSANFEATNLGGYILLNYESDLAGAGVGAHSHSVYRVLRGWDALLRDNVRINNFSVPIPETNYWLSAAGFYIVLWTSVGPDAITFDVECLAGEGKGAGYYDIYADAFQGAAERACSIVWARGRDVFKRFPTDAAPNRINIETARDYRMFTGATTSKGIVAVTTYHSLTWTVAGNITGNDALEPTSLYLVRDSTGEILQTQDLVAGDTTFSFTVYDDTELYYVTAYQDDTHVGRSGLGTPT